MLFIHCLFWVESWRFLINSCKGLLYPEWAALTKVCNFWAKKHTRVMFDCTKDWCKIWKKTTFAFQNDMKNLANFYRLKNRDFILESKLAEINQNIDLCLADSRILYFWKVLESLYKNLHIQQCLFVRWSNKKQRTGWIISNFTKGETSSSLSWQSGALGSNVTMFPQERSSPPLQFGQEENIPGHLIERRGYWFVLKIARMFPIPTSSNRMMNNFITVNITLTCKR